MMPRRAGPQSDKGESAFPEGVLTRLQPGGATKQPGAGDRSRWTASAPAKVILFGEHAVNRDQPALVTAVDLRTYCVVSPRVDDTFTFQNNGRQLSLDRRELRRLKAEIDARRGASDTEAIRARAQREFFAPTAYVLASLLAGGEFPGMDISWSSRIPIGSGLGSGAAASSAMLCGLCAAGDLHCGELDRAALAWQGDIIAHGGIASGLDSSATTFGGIVHYTLAGGPKPLDGIPPLRLVIGDTGIRASTAEVNGRLRAWLVEDPARAAIFPRIGTLVYDALQAIREDAIQRLGALIDENQRLLQFIGVSCPEIEQLTAAARDAGALGAKLSGSGGGGIVIALCLSDHVDRVAAAMERAGGSAMITSAAVEGARLEAPGGMCIASH